MFASFSAFAPHLENFMYTRLPPSTINQDNTTECEQPRNSRKYDQCPLDGKCQTVDLIYQADVESNATHEHKLYIGMTEKRFKQRFSNHTQSIKNEKFEHGTELSKYILQLKRKNVDFNKNGR